MKGTGPCNFSTIVPFGGHDFCMIDSIDRMLLVLEYYALSYLASSVSDQSASLFSRLFSVPAPQSFSSH